MKHSKLFWWHLLSYPKIQNPSPLHLERPSCPFKWNKQTNIGITWAGLKIKVIKGKWGSWKEGRERDGDSMSLMGDEVSGGNSGLSGRWQEKTRTFQQVYGRNCSQSCPLWVAYLRQFVSQVSVPWHENDDMVGMSFHGDIIAVFSALWAPILTVNSYLLL